MRPLSIYCYEDKLVQEAIRRILEAIFEPLFYDEMMGFRPRRNCHQALRKLNVMLEKRPTNYVLDADIKGFFDHLNHDWIMKFIGSKVKDPNFLRLVKRMLKAGIIEDYQFEPTEEGSGQGVSVFTRDSKYLYALCSLMVVSCAGRTEDERILRNHGLRR